MAAYRREKDGADHPPRTPADRMAALLAAATAQAPDPPIATGSADEGARRPAGDAFAGSRAEAPAARGWVPEPPEDEGRRGAGAQAIMSRIPRLLGGGGERWTIRLGAVLIACLLLLGAGCYFAARAAVGRPVSTPVAAPHPAAPEAGAGTGAAPGDPPAGTAAGPGATASASDAPAAEMKVHVVGQVKRPGVVVLAAGARIEDAIRSAGGATPTADLARVNLARPAVDGEQVYVPARGEAAPPAVGGPAPGDAAGPGPDAGAGARVNLNSASEADLDGLPGVGPVTAGKIIAWREANGNFTDVEELLDVPGIGPKTFEDLKDLVTV